jgi:hypothetical protein
MFKAFEFFIFITPCICCFHLNKNLNLKKKKYVGEFFAVDVTHPDHDRNPTEKRSLGK